MILLWLKLRRRCVALSLLLRNKAKLLRVLKCCWENVRCVAVILLVVLVFWRRWKVGFLKVKTNNETIRKTKHKVQCPLKFVGSF